jgi:hypothetical protein
MAYTEEEWKNRILSRIDLCSQVTHLTKGTQRWSALDVLIKILKEKTIDGSKEFIVGRRPAVCFQDAPLYSICQNVDFEDKRSKQSGEERPKYEPYGLMFPKRYVYIQGGRPVIYEDTDYAKTVLRKDEWYRIVNFNLTDPDNIIDWSHEREWRVPDSFWFHPSQAAVLVKDTDTIKKFITKANEVDPEIVTQIRGVVPLSVVFM